MDQVESRFTDANTEHWALDARRDVFARDRRHRETLAAGSARSEAG
jgi:hypothetical protein